MRFHWRNRREVIALIGGAATFARAVTGRASRGRACARRGACAGIEART